jgi:hypothetical protein
MKFKKSQKKAKVAAENNAKSATPEILKSTGSFSGDALTKLVRGFYSENKETAMAVALKELVHYQGYKHLKSKVGQMELTAVMEGKKRFKGKPGDIKAILVTALEKKAV